MMRKGEAFEQICSLEMHKNDIPVLISPLVLRSLGVGQLDLVILKKKPSQRWMMIIYELKTSMLPGPLQMRRLKKAQEYLAIIFQMEVQLKVKFCKNV